MGAEALLLKRGKKTWLRTTANPYTHVLVEESKLDHAALIERGSQ